MTLARFSALSLAALLAFSAHSATAAYNQQVGPNMHMYRYDYNRDDRMKNDYRDDSEHFTTLSNDNNWHDTRLDHDNRNFNNSRSTQGRDNNYSGNYYSSSYMQNFSRQNGMYYPQSNYNGVRNPYLGAGANRYNGNTPNVIYTGGNIDYFGRYINTSGGNKSAYVDNVPVDYFGRPFYSNNPNNRSAYAPTIENCSNCYYGYGYGY
jgi:hypothetical protein